MDRLGREQFPVQLLHVLLDEVVVETVSRLKSLVDLLEVLLRSDWLERQVLGQERRHFGVSRLARACAEVDLEGAGVPLLPNDACRRHPCDLRLEEPAVEIVRLIDRHVDVRVFERNLLGGILLQSLSLGVEQSSARTTALLE